MAWFEWRATDDVPCFFSVQRARENASILQQILSARFFERPSLSHPLRKLWAECTADAYLRLNALAEDLRLGASKDGLRAIVGDLRSSDRWESAQHTLHTAALFERAREGAVVRFAEARNDTTPDFIVDVNGIRVPVETKLALTSVIDDAFQRNVEPAVDKIIASLKNRSSSYRIVLLIQDATAQVDWEAVVTEVTKLSSDKGSYQRSFGNFRIWCEIRGGYFNFRDHREIHIISPVHDKDHLRLKGPAKKASKQLRSLPDTRAAGILALGLSRQHEPSKVFGILENEMRSGSYRGIAATLLIKNGPHLFAPRRSVVDSLEVRRNSKCPHPIDAPIPLRSIDMSVNLTEAEPSGLSKPVYVYAVTQGSIIDPNVRSGLVFQPFNRIANQLLTQC